MANSTSSLIGVDLSGLGGTTQLFALGTQCQGTDGTTWEYVEVTSTHVTGKVVIINRPGTAKVALPAMLTANATGGWFGFAQNAINQGEFAWVATRGRGLYVLVSSSLTAGLDTGFALSANSGRLIRESEGAVGSTMYGFYVLSSVQTADVAAGVLSLMTVTWPRSIAEQR